ncbi:uncharacterized protein LOC127706822 [Mytilus californianus]|uniref:uncharacterized protein LOC127706822 n=1 Tax=Mytilus californianus TaxID=6549 RepID=UPI002244FD69|nr:uncharacterized protein LOC127706822 [Mytilus californianus]XP_052067477.1 uncharacterized protein LOC127706822 [Mytilus californianus]XP_052067478.1 uncharacterized protein LOC127706822 [Mytilus californianus]
MDRMEDLNEIPFSVVGQTAMNSLANKLDPEMSVIGNNWRVLAEKLGFSTEHILNLDCRQSLHGRNTLKLFEDYIKRNGNSVGAVRTALVDMEREDAVEALEEHIPDIREKYRVSINEMQRHRMPSQNSCYEQSTRHESLGYLRQARYPTPPPAHCNPPNYAHSRYHLNSTSPYQSMVYNDLSRNGDTAASRSSNQTKDYNVTSSSYTNNCRSPTDTYPTLRIQESASKIVHVDPSDTYSSADVEMLSDDYPPEEGQPLAAGIQREHHYRNIIKRPLNTNRMEDQEGESPPIHPKRLDLRLNISRGEFASPSPSPASGSGGSIPLAQLDHFTNSNLYMPGTVYNNLMQEKNQQEYDQERRGQNKDPTFKVPPPVSANHKSPYQNGQHILDFHLNSYQVNGQQVPQRRMEREESRTFPLRSRQFSHPSLPPKDRPSILKYSVSVPNDMKPAEYRKAFKHIRVFVTYAGDSKKHIQKVLNLCRCLEKNGFTCCMDMFDKRMPQEQMLNRQEWCAHRFNEADFILMCVSEQYKTEIDMFECESQIDDKELHIQYIYSLMLAELKQNGNKNSRVIPLLFEGCTEVDIPQWLQHTYVYTWPGQYRDLLWCLTKPHTRIKLRSQQNQSTPTSPVNGPHHLL